MRVESVDSFCALACEYCPSLGMLRESPRGGAPFPPGEYSLACNSVFSRELGPALKDSFVRGAVVHCGLAEKERIALLTELAAKGKEAYFLVDRQAFSWKHRLGEAAELGARVRVVILARRSLPPEGIVAEVPAALVPEIHIYFPDAPNEADFFLADEAVPLVRVLRARFPEIRFLPFAESRIPFFASLNEKEYFSEFASHGNYPRIREFFRRAHEGGALWFPVRLGLRVLEFAAGFLLDPKQAKALAQEAQSRAYWQAFHLGAEAVGAAQYGASLGRVAAIRSYWTMRNGSVDAYWLSYNKVLHPGRMLFLRRVFYPVREEIVDRVHLFFVHLFWLLFRYGIAPLWILFVNIYWISHAAFWGIYYSRITYPLRKPFYFLAYQIGKLGRILRRKIPRSRQIPLSSPSE